MKMFHIKKMYVKSAMCVMSHCIHTIGENLQGSGPCYSKTSTLKSCSHHMGMRPPPQCLNVISMFREKKNEVSQICLSSSASSMYT